VPLLMVLLAAVGALAGGTNDEKRNPTRCQCLAGFGQADCRQRRRISC